MNHYNKTCLNWHIDLANSLVEVVAEENNHGNQNVSAEIELIEDSVKNILEHNESIESELDDLKSDMTSLKKQITSITVKPPFMKNYLNVTYWIEDKLNGTTTFMASCQEYYDNGERNNGTFRIRPSIKMPSFEVNCIFTKDFAVTEINPLNSADEIIFPRNESQRCSTPNCFTQKGFQIDSSNISVSSSYSEVRFWKPITEISIFAQYGPDWGKTGIKI